MEKDNVTVQRVQPLHTMLSSSPCGVPNLIHSHERGHILPKRFPYIIFLCPQQLSYFLTPKSQPISFLLSAPPREVEKGALQGQACGARPYSGEVRGAQFLIPYSLQKAVGTYPQASKGSLVLLQTLHLCWTLLPVICLFLSCIFLTCDNKVCMFLKPSISFLHQSRLPRQLIW